MVDGVCEVLLSLQLLINFIIIASNAADAVFSTSHPSALNSFIQVWNRSLINWFMFLLFAPSQYH